MKGKTTMEGKRQRKRKGTGTQNNNGKKSKRAQELPDSGDDADDEDHEKENEEEDEDEDEEDMAEEKDVAIDEADEEVVDADAVNDAAYIRARLQAWVVGKPAQLECDNTLKLLPVATGTVNKTLRPFQHTVSSPSNFPHR
jgi:hypothetical protein